MAPHWLPAKLPGNCVVRAAISPAFRHEIAMFQQLRSVFLQEPRVWSPATPSLEVIPRGFDGKRGVEQDMFRNCRYVANSQPESALNGLVRPAHVEIVRHKFLAD